MKVLPRGAADVVGGNEISTEGIGHGRPRRLAGLDPCGTEICDNLVDARSAHQEKHGVKDLLSPTNTTTQQSQEER